MLSCPLIAYTRSRGSQERRPKDGERHSDLGETTCVKRLLSAKLADQGRRTLRLAFELYIRGEGDNLVSRRLSRRLSPTAAAYATPTRRERWRY
jgi:hypothetical protein